MNARVMRYEAAARRRPWLVALAPAAIAGVVVGAIALVTGQSHEFFRSAVPAGIAAWAILGSLYRVYGRL